MTDFLYADGESRSATDIKKHGAMRHLLDPFAGPNCVSYAEDSGDTRILDYYKCQAWAQAKRPTCDASQAFVEAWHNAKFIVAHNAMFEILYFEIFFGLTKPMNQWIDTMALCAYYGYPWDLDGAAKAFDCSSLKDLKGKAAMLKLVNPIYTPEDCPEDYQALYKYNMADIPPMREIHQKCPPLPPIVFDSWVLDAEINLRGVPIDVVAAHNAVKLRAELTAQASAEMHAVTDGFVPKITDIEKLKEWMIQRNNPMVDGTADTIARVLNTGNLLPRERRALELRQEYGLSSVAKYEKMLDYVVDGRLYQMFNWYGAHTGRPSGRGPQVMNPPRSKESPKWANLIATKPALIHYVARPLEKVKEAVRGTICAPVGRSLLGCDAKQIEARATFWLAGEKGLSLFLHGDPYCTYGKTIFGHEIDPKLHSEKRNASKASVLAFGFMGGIGAGQRIATNYKMSFDSMADVILPTATEDEIMKAQWAYNYYMEGKPVKPLSERQGMAVDILKQRYRRDFWRVPQFAKEIEEAFLYGGTVGKLHIDKVGDLRIMHLPDGRCLYYHDVREAKHQEYTDEDGLAVPEDRSTKGYSYRNSDGARIWIWKGVLVENAAQAVNQSVCSWFKQQCDPYIWSIHHCYDDFTGEVPDENLAYAEFHMKRITQEERTPWMEGLPLDFDYWSGRRYAK